MQAGQSSDLHTLASLPGYQAILRTVIKSQIKQLVEQLSYFAGEEAILISASLSDGTLSHLGSQSGEIFLNTHEKVKTQFLGFCMKRHKKKTSTASHCSKPESPKQAKDDNQDTSHPLTNEDYINFLANLSEKAITANNNPINIENHHAEENHENHEHQENNEINENQENQAKGEGDCEVTGEGYEYSMDTCYDVDGDKQSPGAEGEGGEEGNTKPDVLIIKEEPVDDSYAAASNFVPGAGNSLSAATNQDLLALLAGRKKPQRRRLSFASIERKYWAVLDAEAGKKKKEIATELNIPQSTLSTWIKCAEKIKESYLTQDYSPNRKRCRSSKFPDIDAKLLEWTRESNVLEMELPKQVLMAKANEVARDLGYTEQQFTCSWSWVERFKARYGLANKQAPDPYQ